jgi:acetyl esterase/lipase
MMSPYSEEEIMIKALFMYLVCMYLYNTPSLFQKSTLLVAIQFQSRQSERTKYKHPPLQQIEEDRRQIISLTFYKQNIMHVDRFEGYNGKREWALWLFIVCWAIVLCFAITADGRRQDHLLIICPGGGYTYLNEPAEGRDVARWVYNNIPGLDAKVLHYTTNPDNPLTPLDELNATIYWGKARYKTVGVIGFSAGGHLAATSLVHSSPNYVVLLYPIQSSTLSDYSRSR